MITQTKEKNEITNESILSQEESNSNIQDNLSLNQQIGLSLLYIIITITIVSLLTIISLFRAPLPSEGTILDVTTQINFFLLIIKVLLIFSILPLMIYDIFTNKFLMNIKYQITIIFIICSLTPLLLGYFLAFSALSGNQTLLYLGISPEILISALIFSFALYCLPIYLLWKLDKI